MQEEQEAACPGVKLEAGNYVLSDESQRSHVTQNSCMGALYAERDQPASSVTEGCADKPGPLHEEWGLVQALLHYSSKAHVAIATLLNNDGSNIGRILSVSVDPR